MMRRGTTAVKFIITLALTLSATRSVAAPDEDVEGIYGGDVLSLATGYRIPIKRAPATATVLTREDLNTFGARTLRDALNLIPSFMVSTADGRATVSTVRGITSRVFVMVDGVPITRTLIDPIFSFDNLLLHDVERIEVVRGPGSAIYGADAVAGVINIETRTAAHKTDSEIGVSTGRYDTYDAWSRIVGNVGPVQLGAFASFTTSNGSDRVIQADAQSLLDARFGTNASRAPGKYAQSNDTLEARFDAKWTNITARLVYLDQNPLQTGAGLAFALDPDGEFNSVYKAAQVSYTDALSDSFQLNAYVDFSRVSQDAFVSVFPPGAFNNAFPDGVLSSFLITNDRLRTEATLLYSGLRSHKLRLGFGYLDNTFDTQKDSRNFVVMRGRFLPTGQFAPFGGVGDAPLIGDTSSDTLFALVQDEWQLANDWSLTTGVRADRYSDFGDTVNPRAGLVWNARQNLVVKALVGRAFRPPSVLEQQSSGVFAARGNPDLRPTSLTTGELGFTLYEPTWEADLTLFKYRQSDLIEIIADATSPSNTAYTNSGSNRGWGYEASLKYRLTPRLNTALSYSFQDRIGSSSDNNANIRFAPRHLIQWTADWSFIPDWRAALVSRAVLNRDRALSDPRPDPDNYVLVNAVVTRQRAFDFIDLSVVVNNVFNTDARDASPSATTLPGDLPLPGRTWLFTATARW